MATTEELLTAIVTELRAIRAALPKPPPMVASDAELDGPKGDKPVRWDPKFWTGESYKGKRFSECPSDYLEMLAASFDWQANKDEESGDAEKLKKAGWNRLDAARARGWAKRNHGKAFAPSVATNGHIHEPWNEQF